MNDLTPDEQKNVRTALRFLRARCGGWRALAKSLRLSLSTLDKSATGRRPLSPLVAFRVARFAKVGVDDVLAGRFPPARTCPHCGQVQPSTSERCPETAGSSAI